MNYNSKIIIDYIRGGGRGGVGFLTDFGRLFGKHNEIQPIGLKIGTGTP